MVAENDSEGHLEDAKEDGGLHFHRVEEGQLVGLGQVPDGIHSERIRPGRATGTVHLNGEDGHGSPDAYSVVGIFGDEHQLLLGVHGRQLLGRVDVLPRGAKDVETLGEGVVVQYPRVDGEGPHQEDYVATTEEGLEDL